MIFIFGDSHAHSDFLGLKHPHAVLKEGITMYRVGRDGIIPFFNKAFNGPDSIFIFCHGEIDCRCRIGQQVDLGRDYTEICKELVAGYFATIKKNIYEFKKIIVCSVLPPMSKEKFEMKHGSATDPKFTFPIIHSDEDRVTYTKTVNALIKSTCEEYGYTYLDFWDCYAEPNGVIIYGLSDTSVHVAEGKNTPILNLLEKALN